MSTDTDESRAGQRASSRRRILPWDVDIRLMVLIGLLGLAVLYTLFFARALLVPVTAALLLHQLLYPPVRWLRKLGLPPAAGGAITLTALLALLGLGGYLLADPARQWLNDAPTSLRELGREIRATSGTLDQLRELEKEVDEIANPDDGPGGVTKVEVRGPGLLDAVVNRLPTFAAEAAIAVLTCFFLLAAGDRLGRGLVARGASRDSRRHISMVLRGVQLEISTYLTVITLVNLALGITVALALWGLGVPNPALWGAMVALFNYAPYLGALASASILLVVGVTTFDSIGMALAVPAVFMLLTSLEGGLITPMILGHRMTLGPLAVFLSVVFWGWIWGPAGALMAVPIVASLRVLWVHLSQADPSDPMVRAPAETS